MNLKYLSNVELHLQTQKTAEKERLTTIELLWHLRENEKRMLYSQMGFRDLKEYCVKELKLSEGSAWRRISAMRLLKKMPITESKIKSGDLNLTQIAMARTHFRNVKPSMNQKLEILASLENQSTRQSERILAERKPEDHVLKPAVIEKPLRGQKLEVTLVLDESLQNELEEIQILLGKPYTKLELFKMLAQEKLQSLKKELNKKKNAHLNVMKVDLETKRSAQPALSETPQTQRPQIKNSRYVSRYDLKEVENRDQHRCQFTETATGRQCTARLNLQVEHILPLAKGGQNTANNLQLLCANHNKLRAVQHFGVLKMKTFMPSLN